MKSIDGEVVMLHREVQITPEVELWLGKLSDEMKATLQQLVQQCLQEARMSRAGGLDPSKYPSQILCLSETIRFTDRCEEAIKNGTLSSLKKELEGQLEEYTNVDLSGGKESNTFVIICALYVYGTCMVCQQKLERSTFSDLFQCNKNEHHV